jgi:hypothetical protein
MAKKKRTTIQIDVTPAVQRAWSRLVAAERLNEGRFMSQGEVLLKAIKTTYPDFAKFHAVEAERDKQDVAA